MASLVNHPLKPANLLLEVLVICVGSLGVLEFGVG